MQDRKKEKKLYSSRGTSFLSLSSGYNTQKIGEKNTSGLNQNLDEVEVNKVENSNLEEFDENYSKVEIPKTGSLTSPLDEATLQKELTKTESETLKSSEKNKKSGVISSKIVYSSKTSDTEDTSQTEKISQKTQQSKITKKISKTTKPIKKIQSKPKLTQEQKAEIVVNKVSSILDWIMTIKQIFKNPYGVSEMFSRKYSELVKRNPSLGKMINKIVSPFLFIHLIKEEIKKRWGKGIKGPRKDIEENERDYEEPERGEVTFLELSEKGIIFCDNKKRPLYTLEQLKDKSGYTASPEVINPIIMNNILNAFYEVAPKAKAIPTPETGKYAGIPMDEVMANITEEEVMTFLYYVKRFPRGYVGKNFRITESFAGWVVSGTPND